MKYTSFLQKIFVPALLFFCSNAQAQTPLTIGTIPQGDSIVVRHVVTVSPSTPQGTAYIANQWTIKGTNFSNFVTDDPDTPAPNDSTKTAITVCNNPSVPTIGVSQNPVCPFTVITLSITAGSLNDATDWKWYSGSCGGTPVGQGMNISVSPSATTTYYVRGEGNCVVGGPCASVTIDMLSVNVSSVTQPTCSIPSGTIILSTNAVSGVIEYRLNGGIWQTSNTFSGLPAGPYNVDAKYQGENCFVSFSGNPVTINTVPITPTVNPVGNQTVCNNSSTATVSFSGSPAGTVYNWSNNDPSIGLAGSGQGDIPSFTATNATNAPVTATITVTPNFTNAGGSCNGTPVTFTITVNPTPTINAVANQILCNGEPTAAITFSGAVPGTVYNWTNNTSSIGLAGSGSGDIASFNAVNTTADPVVATITVTPSYTNGGTPCAGSPSTFTITVNPTPTVNTVPDLTVCNGAATGNISFSGATPGTIYSWTNTNNSIGLASSGTGNITSFNAVNSGTAPVSASVTVTPGYPSSLVAASSTFNFTGAMQTFTVPVGVTSIVVETWGAQGQTIGSSNGGLGGYAKGTLAVTPGQVLNIFVGGQNGFNGGGAGSTNVTSTGNGGGATDLRAGGITLNNRVLVAGGGGGSGYSACNSQHGGAGGYPGGIGGIGDGVKGDDGTLTAGGGVSGGGNFSAPTCNPTSRGGGGGGQNGGGGQGGYGTSIGGTGGNCGGDNSSYSGGCGNQGGGGGCFGQGGNSQVNGCSPGGGGGGGGWYGGGSGGANYASGGGGGSSYIGGVTNSSTSNGTNTGNGSLKISYVAATMCTGTPKTFTITVNPTPTVNAVPDQAKCNGEQITAVSFSGAVTGTVYKWTNNAPSIGLASNGTGDIAPFTATNNTTAPVVATITVTPEFTNAGSTCLGTPVTFTISVDPTPDVDQPANVQVCDDSTTAPVVFTGTVPGTMYRWTNSNPSIGLAVSGTGNISPFTATNTTNAPVTATIIVSPSSGGSGSLQTFNYTGTLQSYTVPAGVTSIEIEAAGAQGGGSSFGSAGGKGANMKGTYAVTPGQVLSIVVGQQGLLQAGGNSQNSSGGGGGTFVFAPGPTLLVAAGGGGGKCNWTSSQPLHAQADGQVTLDGGASSDGAPGGINGNGGTAGMWSGTPCAGGGTGWLTPGGSQYGGQGHNTWTGGPGFCGGGGGGCGGVGGFGGGGGGGNHYGGGGGGGGYSGGGGGTDPTHGGGGGSFSSGINQSNTPGAQSGNGFVTITPTITACTGTSKTFTITVNPTPDATATPTSQTTCSGQTITTISSSGSVSGTVYNWTRDNTISVTGIASSGTGDISGQLINNTPSAVSVTFTITPTANGCPGSPITATVVVNPDANNPTITCPADKTLSCEESTLPANTGAATATDDCDPSPAVTYTDVSTQNANTNHVGHYNYTITRTWKATDLSNKIATCVQIITVKDTIPPMIVCPINKTVNINCPVSAVQPMVSDNCNAPFTLTGKRSDRQPINAPFPVGTTQVRWTVVDINGNAATCIQHITVVNNVGTCPPSPKGDGPKEIKPVNELITSSESSPVKDAFTVSVSPNVGSPGTELEFAL